MQNSARIQSLVQQLVDALVDEITTEVSMRTGNTVSTPVAAPLPSFDLNENMDDDNSARPLPAWDDLPMTASTTPSSSPAAETPKFETPDFDQLLRDLEELRKPLENKQVQEAEVVPSQPAASDAMPAAASMHSGTDKPFSGLDGANDLLKRVTGK